MFLKNLSPGALWAHRIATVFNTGFFPMASGTYASLLTCAVFFATVWVLPSETLIFHAFLWILLLIISWSAVETYLGKNKNKDPSEVVVDEVLGQWCTLITAIFALDVSERTISESSIILLSFFMFRFWDITKIWPVCHFDKKSGAYGIILDDVAAGLISGGIIAAFILF